MRASDVIGLHILHEVVVANATMVEFLLRRNVILAVESPHKDGKRT